MIYRLCHGNHHQTGAIHETFHWLQQLLFADGQRVQYGELPYGRIEGNYVNVVVENFVGDRGSFFANAHTGGDWICVGTELLGSQRFNEHDTEDSDYWLTRFDAFLTAAESALELWLTVHDPESIERYKALFPSKPVRLLSFPKLCGTTSDQERKIDVLFIGRVTEYRKYVLDAIKRCGARVIVLPEATPGNLRDAAIDQAKVLLCLPEKALVPRSSSVQVWYGLQRGACVVTRRSEGDELNDIVGAVPVDGIVPRCVEVINQGYEWFRDAQQQKFMAHAFTPLGLPTFAQLIHRPVLSVAC